MTQMANAENLLRSSKEFLLESPTTIEAFPLTNKPLNDTVPEVVKIDTPTTLVASTGLSTHQFLDGLPPFNRLSFPFKYF